jgi:hypothetical protein
MSNSERGKSLGFLIFALIGLVFAPFAFADDNDDVLAWIYEYGELEDDLAAQSRMIRDDRVMITAVRQTDNAKNMAIQIANRKAGEAVSGGKTKFITTIESPQVAIYGNVAVASFVRMFNVYPHNQQSVGGNPQWVTVVLVKEGGDWKLAHTHISAAGGN